TRLNRILPPHGPDSVYSGSCKWRGMPPTRSKPQPSPGRGFGQFGKEIPASAGTDRGHERLVKGVDVNAIAPATAGYLLDEYDAERFWSRVNLHGGRTHEGDVLATATGECWAWTGARNGKGYGWFRLHGRVVSPHRVAYVD